MKKLKIYLDTSAIGYLDEQSHPSEMRDMQTLWDCIKQDEYTVVISEVTLTELNANMNVEKANKLTQFINQIKYDKMLIDDEVIKIAELVKSTNLLVSDKSENDRLHIGCALVSGCDVLVSYNFKHMSNVRTVNGVRGISTLSGYGNINIVPAAMLIESEGDSNDNA